MPSHERIRLRRVALGLTQAELAAKLKPYLPGITENMITKIETGRRAVRLDEAPAFAKALECRVEDLVDQD